MCLGLYDNVPNFVVHRAPLLLLILAELIGYKSCIILLTLQSGKSEEYRQMITHVVTNSWYWHRAQHLSWHFWTVFLSPYLERQFYTSVAVLFQLFCSWWNLSIIERNCQQVIQSGGSSLSATHPPFCPWWKRVSPLNLKLPHLSPKFSNLYIL